MTPRGYYLNIYIVPDKVKDSHLDVLLIYVDIAHGCGCLNELSNDNLKSAVRLHLI